MSFGSPNKEEKFYKGAKNDTAWNKAQASLDLLWRYHVNKEVKQAHVNAGELPADPTVKLRHPRMRMGMTGTLIPDVTPRYDDEAQPQAISINTSRRRASAEPDATSISRARSVKSSAMSSASWRSSSSSALTATSSQRSVRLEDVQRILENESKLLQEKTNGDVAALRRALEDEATKREAAEKKLAMLCEKLGVQD